MTRSPEAWRKKTAEQIVVRGDFMDRPDKSLAKVMHGMAEMCKDMPGFVGVSAAGSRTLGYSITEESRLPNIPAGYRSDYDLNVMFDISESGLEIDDANLRLDLLDSSIMFKAAALGKKYSTPEISTSVCDVNPVRFRNLLMGMIRLRNQTSDVDQVFATETEVAQVLQAVFLVSTGGAVKKYQIKIAKIVSDCFSGRKPADWEYFSESISNMLAGWDSFRFFKMNRRIGLSNKDMPLFMNARKELWRQHLQKYLKLRAAAVKS